MCFVRPHHLFPIQVEYPLYSRRGGFEKKLSYFLWWLGTLLGNYYIRAVLYVGAAIPCFLMTPGIICGAALLLAAGVYGYAGSKGEKYEGPP